MGLATAAAGSTCPPSATRTTRRQRESPLGILCRSRYTLPPSSDPGSPPGPASAAAPWPCEDKSGRKIPGPNTSVARGGDLPHGARPSPLAPAPRDHVPNTLPAHARSSRTLLSESPRPRHTVGRISLCGRFSAPKSHLAKLSTTDPFAMCYSLRISASP